MLSYLGLIPALLAWQVASKTSPSEAFLRVYLPVLLCLPGYYRVITPGLPDPNFHQGAAIAILLVALMRGGFKGYRFSHLDIVVFIYGVCVFNSELLASGYSDAQNLLIEMLFSIFVPYLMAKSYIEPGGLRFDFARRVVLCIALVSLLDVYETRFGANPWQLVLSRFFPGQGEGWLTTFRFGMARTSGPYGHALIAGIIMLVGFRLQRWLQFSAAWPKRLPQLGWLPVPIPVLLTLIITGGFFITFAKGSWLAGILAGTLVGLGRMRNRMLALIALLGFVLLVLVPAAVAFINYASVGRANAKDDNQETAAYRYELITEYLDIAKEKALWGWGLTKWPKVSGMPSIDNHYLLLLLMHGQIALICFLYILGGSLVRLLLHSARSPPPPRSGASLAYTLASIFLGYMVAIGTVYMGGQATPVLFLLAGWAESFMQRGGFDYPPEGNAGPAIASATTPFVFQRVL